MLLQVIKRPRTQNSLQNTKDRTTQPSAELGLIFFCSGSERIFCLKCDIRHVSQLV